MVNFYLEILGGISLFFYFARWFFQLKASNKAGRSVTPVSYWLITILASVLFATYSFLLGSIVFPISFIFTICIAVYNIYLELKREKERIK